MKEKVLYYYNSTPISQKDIESSLKGAGLKKGDTVMVHSDVRVFGKLGDVHDKEKFLDSILDAFLNVLGSDGTLIVPTFTYSFCKNKVFDVKNTSSTVGIFTEHVRKKKEAVRSIEPIFSCAGIGKHSKKMLENISSECFGKDSVFDRLHGIDGKIMLFGRSFDITYVHYIENAFKVSYRFNKKFSGTIINENGIKYYSEFDYYVRYLDRNVNYRMENLGDELFKRGLLKRTVLGHNNLLICKAKDAFDVGIEMLRKNEFAFLANIPDVTKNVKND